VSLESFELQRVVKKTVSIAALLFATALLAHAAVPPLNDRVLVVYNAGARESRGVADYYMTKRDIPAANSCAIKVSSPEAIDAVEFESRVKAPLRKCLDAVGKEKILYIVFSYQTPFDLTINGQNYALDSFVADIWDEYLPFRPAAQAEIQPYFGQAQSEGNLYQPFIPLSGYRESSGARHIYSVWRLDAQTPALAKGLVDKVLFAEAHGLSGKGCFDLSAPAPALFDYSYGGGNWDIYQAEQFARRAGFPIVEDTHEQEFGTAPAPLRCDDAALYAGWYSLNHYNDAFTWDPGAIGIHLDSASALNPRAGPNWVANALLKGITVTSGAVAEPFLDNLPHPDRIFLYLFQGANVGDAVLRGTRLLKWMILNIGDPLYRPFPNGVHAAPSSSPDLILALAPQETVGDSESAAIIAIDRPAPENGLNFSVRTDPPGLVDVPKTVLIPAGSRGVKFAIHSHAVQNDGTTVHIFVSADRLTRSNTLVLFPILAPLALSPATIHGRSSASGTVLLRHPAPSEGMTVALSSSNPSVVSLPPEIKVPAGQRTATFEIAAHAVTAQNSIAITASCQGVARTANLTVVP